MSLHNERLHTSSLDQLFEQRLSALSSSLTGVDVLTRVESRIRRNLYVLAFSDREEEEPGSAGDVFCSVASAILRRESDAYERALALIAGDDELARGAFEAVALLPPGKGEDVLTEAYRHRPELRQKLLRLWQRTAADIPNSFLNASELQRHDPSLQVLALRCAADSPRVGLDVFRAYYTDYQVPTVIAAEALWGGLRRGDEDATVALGRFLERAERQTERDALLRLMALGGRREYWPVLREHAAREAVEGARLLALAGVPALVPDLLALLERPESSAAAADAWFWLTGTRLPERARVAVAESGGAQYGSLPDAEWAAGWWQRNRPSQASEGRLLFGKPMDSHAIIAASKRWAGRHSRDLLDLVALNVEPVFRIHHEDWLAHRFSALKGLCESAELEVEEDLTERDRWERGHFAGESSN